MKSSFTWDPQNVRICSFRAHTTVGFGGSSLSPVAESPFELRPGAKNR